MAALEAGLAIDAFHSSLLQQRTLISSSSHGDTATFTGRADSAIPKASTAWPKGKMCHTAFS